MPQLNPEFWVSQIFWLTLVFGTLYVLLSKFILPKISNNLETRKSQIVENIEAAEKQREESDQKIRDYENIINEAKIEAKNIFNQTTLPTMLSAIFAMPGSVVPIASALFNNYITLSLSC